MDYDGLFLGSKWKILELISQKPSSLQELAKSLGTSLANISQQVRFLEFAGLVDRKKVPRDGAGKPESELYVKNDFSYMVMSTKAACKKSLLKLDAYQQLMLYSWIGLEGKERDSFEGFLISQKKDLGVVERIYSGTQVGNSGMGSKDRLPLKFYVFTDGAPSVSKKTFGSLDFLFFGSSSKEAAEFYSVGDASPKKKVSVGDAKYEIDLIFKR